MNDEKRTHDEILLIDFLRGECPPDQAESVRARLEADAAFRRLHDDLRNVESALRLLPEVEPPEDLVAGTLSRIDATAKTERLLAREELKRQRVLRPTFSLREAAAIAAAVILLGAIFLPSVRLARYRALRNQCYSNVGQIGYAMQTYANENDGALPVAAGTARRWLPEEGQPVASNSTGLFRLVKGGRASPVLFQCPAVGGGSFVVRSGMVDFPAPQYVNYSYQYSLGASGLNRHDPTLAAVAEDMAILADDTPLFRNGVFRRDRMHRSASDNHGGTGQNVLYLPGNAEWHEVATVGVDGDDIFMADGVDHYHGVERPTSPTDSFLLPSHSGDQSTANESGR
jgi:hypothetical protein